MAQATEAISVLIDKYNEAPYKDYEGTNLIEAARYAIANASSDPDDYALLETAAKGFKAVMTAAWEKAGKPTKDITLASGHVKTGVESYYVNISKQTMEESHGGYKIDSLSEWELVFFLAEALQNAADAFKSY